MCYNYQVNLNFNIIILPLQIRQLCKITYHHFSSRCHYPCEVSATDPTTTSLNHGHLGFVGGGLDTGFDVTGEGQKSGDVEFIDGVVEGSERDLREGSKDDASKVEKSFDGTCVVVTSSLCEVAEDFNGSSVKHEINENRPDAEMVENDDTPNVEDVVDGRQKALDEQNIAQTTAPTPTWELNEEKNHGPNSEAMNSKLAQIDSDNEESNEEEPEEVVVLKIFSKFMNLI